MDKGYLAEKQALEAEARQKLANLESQVKGVKTGFTDMGTTTLIVGGLFVAGLVIGRKLFRKKKPVPFNDPDLNQLVVKYPKEESYIAKKIKEHIALFLIAMLKERFAALMSNTQKNEPVR